MASYSDDKLRELIDKLGTDDIKALLRKSGIACPSGTRRDQLAWRLFAAIRMGFEVLDSADTEDQRVMDAKARKLDIDILDRTISLPHPLTIDADAWDTSFGNYPNTLDTDVDNYLSSCNTTLGVDTEGEKSQREGKSLLLSGHVSNVRYFGISTVLSVCFIFGEVVPQTGITEKPYFVWVQIFKATGKVRTADCHCIAGVSGCCKHVAALLYFVVKQVTRGLNTACTAKRRKRQQRHAPSKKARDLAEPAFIADIPRSKITSESSLYLEERQRRDAFDPRSIQHRRPKTLADMRLDVLAELTGNQAAILMFAGPYLQPRPQTKEADADNVVAGETVETSEQLHVTTGSQSQGSVVSSEPNISNFSPA